MNQQKNKIRQGVTLITAMFVLAGLYVPSGWVESNLFSLGAILLLAGIPHGASDLLIFRQLVSGRGERPRQMWFLVQYLGLILVYACLWWIAPVFAFLIFLLVAAYHFGQSNWAYIEAGAKGLHRNLTYFLWGIAILSIPILLHFAEAASIIFEITGWELVLSDSIRAALIFLAIAVNLINMVELNDRETISGEQLRKELFKFFLLVLLFFCTPLLIGFGVYFVLWHSFESTLDQISFFQQKERSFSFKKYIWTALPFTLLALLFLIITVRYLGDAFNVYLNLGLLFMFISLITVPHALLMDRLYTHIGNKFNQNNF